METKLQTDHKRSRLRSCIGSLFFAIAILILYHVVALAIYLFAVIPWQIEHGYDLKGAKNKWYQAMQNKDGKQAIYWAKRVESYDRSTARYGVYNNLALAYELDGQKEIADLYYQLASHARAIKDDD